MPGADAGLAVTAAGQQRYGPPEQAAETNKLRYFSATVSGTVCCVQRELSYFKYAHRLRHPLSLILQGL